MRALVASLALALLTGCAETNYFPTSDGSVAGEGACHGNEMRCTLDVLQRCVNGAWVSEDCARQSKHCYPTAGCRTCEPGSDFCDGQDVFHCSADGEGKSKVKTCAADQQCVVGTCVSLCDLTRRGRSNVGCEFWAVDLPNEYYCVSLDGGQTCGLPPFGYGCAACEDFAVAVANTNNFPVTVTIEVNEAEPGQPLKLSKVTEKGLAASSLEVFKLGMREVDCTVWQKDASGRLRRQSDSQTCLSSRAFRVKSTAPVVAYQFNPLINDFSNGASLLIPTNGLDLEYYVIGCSTSNPIAPLPSEGIPDYMNLTIIGIKEQTQVEVKLAHQIQGSKDGKIPAAKKGETIKLTLGPFDVANLNTIQDLGSMTGDLTGSVVRANKPVAVFSGGQRISVPGFDVSAMKPPPPLPADAKGCCTEHMEQQMFPVSSLGTKFVITRTPIRSKGSPEPDFYRVLAVKQGVATTIKTNLTEFPTLTIKAAGEYVDFWSTRDFVLESDQPIMIAQYAVAQGYLEEFAGGAGGDPEVVVFAPKEQFRKDYIFLTPPTFTKDYVIIAAPVGVMVKLDGKDVGAEFSTLCQRVEAGQLDGETFQAIRCPVEDGVHYLESTRPVGIMVYGYYNVGSYGYPGGADVKQINID